MLYKYHSIQSEEHLDYVYDTIVRNKLFFKNPFEFNDPFDCQLTVTVENVSPEKLAQFGIILYSMTIPGFNTESTDRVINAAHTNKNLSEQISQSLKEVIDQLNNATMIHCLSEVPDDILMWSHYASAHSGITIGYNKNKLLKHFKNNVFKVDYHDNYPSLIEFIDNFPNPLNSMKLFLLRKSTHWKYEKEWRVLQMSKNKYFDIPKDIIESLIFGCRCKKPIRDRIIKEVSRHNLNLKLFEAVKNNSSYKVDIQPIR